MFADKCLQLCLILSEARKSDLNFGWLTTVAILNWRVQVLDSRSLRLYTSGLSMYI